MKPKEIDLGFKIDERILIKRNFPVEEIPISEIIENADICYLEKEGTDDWNLSPNNLIQYFKDEPTHAKKVNNADLKYPIIIYWFRDHWIILDGIHRFTKALMQNLKTIKVKKVPNSFIQSIGSNLILKDSPSLNRQPPKIHSSVK